MSLGLVAAVLLQVLAAPPLDLPSEWTQERPPPYPNLVASYLHRDGARLTVAVQFVGAGEDGESLARGNAEALQRMGFQVSRARDALKVTRAGEAVAVRQVYIVRGTVGWVVTLAGEDRQLRPVERSLMTVARQLAEEPPTAPVPPRRPRS
jgi:hypothetical protein